MATEKDLAAPVIINQLQKATKDALRATEKAFGEIFFDETPVLVALINILSEFPVMADVSALRTEKFVSLSETPIIIKFIGRA